MKSKLFFLLFIVLASLTSCDLFDFLKPSIDGEESPMGAVGATLYSSSQNGVTNATATVTAFEDGVSTYSGSATITNEAILNVVSNIPEFTVSGNQVSVTGLKFKVTKEGVESENDSYPGILVKYDSKVGDKYSAGSGVKREVISKSTDNDYPYYFYDIKVMKVEESPSVIPGIKKIVYVANHKFGIVGVDVTFDDNTAANFTVGGSEEND